MQHARQGYILFLLFSMLSACSVLLSLCFSRIVVYKKLAKITVEQQACGQLALGALAFAQDLLLAQENEPEKTTATPTTPASSQAKSTNGSSEKNIGKMLVQVMPYFNTSKELNFSLPADPFNATIIMSMQSEEGKLNVNSLYDFEKKKFIDEGKPTDRKKICVWLFDKIAAYSGKPNLMQSFENYLKSQTCELNDITQLLSIKEFADQFTDATIPQAQINTLQDDAVAKKTSKQPLYLAEIFTICSEQTTITPGLFSPSWCILLDLKEQRQLKEEEINAIFSKIKNEMKWESDWDSVLEKWYKKSYKDLPQEIKSILTTKYEANIFSLLLTAKIDDTSSSIFATIKPNKNQVLIHFDIIKMYQF